VLKRKGGYWIAGRDTIISFEQEGASDNAKPVVNLRIFSFDRGGSNLKSVTTAGKALWSGDRVTPLTDALKIEWSEAGVFKRSKGMEPSVVGSDPFQRFVSKPSHLNITEVREKIEEATSDSERRKYAVSLYKKFATLFLPFIMVLFTAPFALSIQRTGNVVTIAYAAGVWLLFMGAVSVFGQMGSSGLLPASISVGGPLALFALVGLMLLSRIRT
jgi:lipopolysaccharide export LptBFGC system permease protein LptF